MSEKKTNSTFSISKFVKAKLPYGSSKKEIAGILKLKEKNLGKKYNLSVVIVGDQKARNLNIKYRNKNYIPNVLSFPIEDNQGEIFINLNRVHIESKKFEMTEPEFFAYLLIHGILHLKGHDHGPKMEKLEEIYLRSLGFKC